MIGAYFTVFLLCEINMINYMDRFTIAGVLKEVKDYFDMNNAQGGLLQTAFIASYMIFAPVFGFLGDRYSRKYIIVVGVLFWSSVTLLSSFVQRHHTYWFFLFRALVGIGEASYATVAPTIIADLFVGKKRTTILAMFYLAIPIGSGLGYIVGISMASFFGHWKWALRFTPLFGVISVICFLFVKEPERGALETTNQRVRAVHEEDHSTLVALKQDITYLFKVPSFVLTTLGFTCVSFAIGALSWWAPYFMQLALQDISEEKVGFYFGLIACFSGLIGVTIGGFSSQYFRPKFRTADPVICAIGVLIAIPAIFLCIYIARANPTVAWLAIFMGNTFMSLNWSVVVDILLYVIVPKRRSSAQAIQILTAHFLGDAASPFIIGAVSDALYNSNNDRYMSLSYALYLNPFVLIFGVGFFLYSARFVPKDEYNCKIETQGADSETSSNDHSTPTLQSVSVPTNESSNNLINAGLFQRNVEYRNVPQSD